MIHNTAYRMFIVFSTIITLRILYFYDLFHNQLSFKQTYRSIECMYLCVCVCVHVHVCLLLNKLSLNSDQILYCQYTAYNVRNIKTFIKVKCEPYEAGYNYVNQKICT